MLKLGEKSRSPFLLFLIFLFFTSAIFANENENIVFEKGDAIYSDMGEDNFLEFLGHCGLYWEWEDLNDEGIPNDLKIHKVIESLKNVGGI